MSNTFKFPDPGDSDGYFAFDPDLLMAQLAARVREVAGADFTMVALQRNGGLFTDHLVGNRTEALKGIHVHPGFGLGGSVSQSSTVRRLDDYLSSPAISHQYDSAVRSEVLGSMLALPVIIEGSVAGVAYVAQRSVAPFSDVMVNVLLREVRDTELAIRTGLHSESVARIAVDEARNRTAHALHDSVGALLFAIEAGAKRIGEVAGDDLEMSGRANEIAETAAAAALALRTSISGLTESAASLSPIATLRTDLRELETRSGISAGLVLPHGAPTYTTYHGAVIVATCRELLRNAERHSRADRIVLSLMEKNDGFTAVVSDNGIGAADIVEGVGLAGCRRRVERIGGHLELRNDPEEQGLTVKLWIPA